MSMKVVVEMSKRGAMTILAKAFLVIFLVIFVFIFLIISYSSKTTEYKQKEYFSDLDYSNSLLQTIMNRKECYNFEGVSGQQIKTQNLLDYPKLQNSNGKNQDLKCIKYFKGIVAIEVFDNERKLRFDLSVSQKEPKWADNIIKVALPVAIRYTGDEITLGEARLTLITGELPGFYSTIKKSCFYKKDFRLPLRNKVKVSYNNVTNEFCFGDDCFYASFPCEVESFSIKKGIYVLQVRYNNDENKVRVIV